MNIELTEFYATNVPRNAKKELYVYCNVCEISLWVKWKGLYCDAYF